MKPLLPAGLPAAVPLPAGAALPPEAGGQPPTNKRAVAYVELALADRWAQGPSLPDQVAAAALLQQHPGLSHAVRHACAAEEAAVRRALRGGRQVLHIGYGLGRRHYEPHQWWRRSGTQQPRPVAVTTCAHAYNAALEHCTDPVELLYEPTERLPLLLDNPYLRWAINLTRPVDAVLAGTHRAPRTQVAVLLDLLLGTLAPGSTLALTGLAAEDEAERQALKADWAQYTGVRSAILHHRSPGGLISRLRRFDQQAALLPPHQYAQPGVYAIGAVYRIGGPT
ncbi:hypothetical protein [Kitasatospora sp. NPDC088783]|uniref:hypothetical protein n=1 Tax=Kitasatospora sp. NPDC088783 TaxID=3364077 RepID=UPI00380AEBB0